MALWPAKKDQDEEHLKIEVPDVPETAGNDAGGSGDAPNQLEQLCARLDQLGGLLNQANRQVLAYLIDRESKTSALAAGDRAAAALAEKIDGLSEKLSSRRSRNRRAKRYPGEASRIRRPRRWPNSATASIGSSPPWPTG
ncbi:MAG: hypothetical protein ACYSWU_16165 [Planctomycetota bacterium]|jgi:hypothetical protein